MSLLFPTFREIARKDQLADGVSAALAEQGMRGAVINCIIAANEAGKKLGKK